MRRPGSLCPRFVVSRASAVLATLLLLTACESTQPRGPGAIQVQSTVSNPEFSFFTYGIAIDGGAPFDAFSTEPKTILVKGLAHGEHSVSLKNLPVQCTAGVDGPDRTVTLVGDDTVGVVFSVVCARTTGDLRIIVSTTGSNPDPNGYFVTLDGFLAAFVPPNANSSIAGLTPDLYTVGLEDVASNCSYGGPQNASVSAGNLATVTFTVTCAPLAHIKVVASTTGPEPDPDGYLLVTQDDTALVSPTATTVVPVKAGTVTYAMRDLQPNCAFDGPSSGETTMTGGDTLTLTLAATCTALPAGTTALEHDDTVGDTLPNGGAPIHAHDLSMIRTAYAPDWLIVTMKWAQSVAGADAEASNSLYGYLEIDADENAATGPSPLSNDYGASATIGVSHVLLIHEILNGAAIIVSLEDFTIAGLVPVRFDGDSVRVYFPLEKLGGDDGNVTMVMLYGTADRPTDFAANTGNLVSHAPAPMIAGAAPAGRTAPPARMRLPLSPELKASLRAAGTWKPRR